ncbi:MAG: glutamyl-tRNA reductase [Polyangiaceae bacterium]|nr:glutamyl-tRNA reductase [Polyangiaceae bacterium]
MIGIVGLSHATAPIEVRERLAVPVDHVPRLLEALVAQPEVAEAMLISTCNRAELLVAPAVGLDAVVAVSRARDAMLARAPGIEPYLHTHYNTAAFVHLFRVAASLDSLVVGEPQILGQVKASLALARRLGAVGARIDRTVARAIRAAKRVRTETALGAGQVSVPCVALELARRIFDELAGRTVLLIGSGEVAEAVARFLRTERARVLVVGRNAQRVAEVARSVGGELRSWEALAPSLVEADVVVSSTAAPHHVIDLELVHQIRRRRRGRSLFFIDLAVPRDIDPRVDQLDGVFCYNVDDLARVVSESKSARVRETEAAERIVKEEVERLERWFVGQRATPVSVALRRRVRAMLELELERSLAGRLKHLGVTEREQLRVMLNAATKRLCHAPTLKLRELAVERVVDGDRVDVLSDALVELFDLESAVLADEEGTGDSAVPTSRRDHGETSPPRSRPSGVDIDDVRPHSSASARTGGARGRSP